MMHWQYLDIRQITDAVFKKWYAMADAARRARCDACCAPEDRLFGIAADHLARTMVAAHCGASPASIRFARTEAGKPYALGLDVHFNISHSGHYVVCAVSDSPVGIDVEKIRPIRAKLANKVCTPAELSWLREAPGWGEELTGEAMFRFFRIWTTKEAYFKGIGTGITNLKAFDTLSHVDNAFELDGHIVSIYE